MGRRGSRSATGVAADGRQKDRCPWCGGRAGHAQCDDLDGIQTSLLDLLCTRSPDCEAAADQHEDDCPVEIELKAIFGF